MNLMMKEIMMSDKNQPAFPVQDASTWQAHGMTLRDYFAAKAMQAVIARGDDTNRPGMAEWSYAMADAMLAAREAK
jgi:hypothetical protein